MTDTRGIPAWKAVVGGIDDSPEGVHAANLALAIARKANVDCHLVNGAPNAWAAASAPELPLDIEALNDAVVAAARSKLLGELASVLRTHGEPNLEVRLGSPAMAIKDAVADYDAGLVVLGGKHHPTVLRWFGGSTVHNVIRTSDVPVLVAKGDVGDVHRVLVAVDVSYAAGPTLQEAKKFADLFAAELQIVHVIESLPVLATLPVALEDAEYRDLAEAEFNHIVKTVLGAHASTKVIVHGDPADAVTDLVTNWSADLLVVGSHGKGWVSRLLVGSITERMLNSLPTNLLVVRVPEPADGTGFRTSSGQGREGLASRPGREQ